MKKLELIQQSLKAPKGQFNKHGGYAYRSCEDILSAVKPLLDGAVLTISDEIVAVADRVYVKATATLSDGKDIISTTAFAREAAIQKGMHDPQITGAASSYARKYALNGLFAIDDTKDADNEKPLSVTDQISNCRSIGELTKLWETLSQHDRDQHKDQFGAAKIAFQK